MKLLVSADAVLCSDGANGYAKFAVADSIEYFVDGRARHAGVAAGCYHIQNVNSLHARYDKFIKSFCGPVTKNLNG